MAAIKEDLTNARYYLRSAYTALKDARTYYDGIIDVESIHYHNITKIMEQVNTIALICKIELDRLEQRISTSKES